MFTTNIKTWVKYALGRPTNAQKSINEAILRPIVTNAARRLVRRIQSRIPVNQDPAAPSRGRFRQSWSYRVTKDSKGSLQMVVFPDPAKDPRIARGLADLLLYTGAKRHRIAAKPPRIALRFVSNGNVIMVRSVNHPGYPKAKAEALRRMIREEKIKEELTLKNEIRKVTGR
jgi:hypothetical protein